MGKKRRRIKDSQVRKNLRWHVLRLLRLGSRSKEELTGKLSDMYLGYWKPNEKLIEAYLQRLVDEGLVEHTDRFEITPTGMKALDEKEQEIDRRLGRFLSKEACAQYSLWGNVGLSALEFIVGFLSGSIGLIADAVHTAIDIVASAITWVGIRVNKEAQAALVGGIILCGIGAYIAFESITKVFRPAHIQLQIVALVTIVINIAVNAVFSFYKFYVGGRTRSISLVADAYHTKTDIWSSVAVLVGLLGALFGFFVLDAVAGAVVSLFILLGGYELIKESRKVMQGEDPKLEKFSKFLKSHLEVLPERGVFVSLWLLSLKEMTWKENLERMKNGLGKHFPVKLKESDYESIHARLEQDGLVESAEDKLRLSKKGRALLKDLAIEKPAYLPWLHRETVVSPMKIDWFAEGL
jgi:cation diffusion facilitator family transporter